MKKTLSIIILCLAMALCFSATMGNLVKALYNYGVSAKEYAASQNN